MKTSHIKIIVTLFLFLFAVSTYSKADLSDRKMSDYEVNPDLITEDTDAVVNYSEQRFIIKGKDKTEYYQKESITILNKNADDYAIIVQNYDDNTKIKSIEAALYDKNGKLIKQLKQKDFKDYSAVESFSLYSDSRLVAADLRHDEYPYTVSYEIEVKKNYHYNIPSFYPNKGYNVAAKKSSYYLEYPPELKPRLKMSNMEQVAHVHQKKENSQFFELNNLSAVKYEPYAPSIGSMAPLIRFSPTKFKFDRYEGDFSTWDGMARWQKQLNEDLDELTELTKKEVQQISKGMTKREQVYALYKYMQSRTRYVSIQLGIGGLQPFSPETVDKNGYGDCKALSFFMKSILKEAEIESFYSYIYGGDNPPEVDEDFPYDNFNHIVLAVPLEEDTIWLECTSQSILPGYLGSFTSSRKAVAINDAGKALILETPEYDSLNEVKVVSSIVLSDDGSASTNLVGSFKAIGSEYGGLEGLIEEEELIQKRWLRSFLDVSNVSVSDFQFKKGSVNYGALEIPNHTLKATYNLRRLAVPADDRLVINPNLIETWTMSFNNNAERIAPIKIDYTNQYKYAFSFKLPEGYELKDYPTKPQIIKTKYGRYKYFLNYNVEEGELLCEKSLVVNNGIYSADEYSEIVSFFTSIENIENHQLILTKR